MVTGNLILNVYSIMILIIIYIHSVRHSEKNSLQYKLYMMMVRFTILMLVIDIFSRFDGNPDTLYPVINSAGNFLIYLLNPVVPTLWILYVHYQVLQEEKIAKRWLFPLLFVNVAYTVSLVISQFYGWFYYIDPYNIYHRGPLFWIPASTTILMILAAFALIVANRGKVGRKHYFSLLFFAVPPFICVILQIFIYGISLMLNSVVLSLLIVFFNIQIRTIYTDYLTGINNRKKLEAYMEEKISRSTGNKTFSAILTDMDNFKSINDMFGHDMGDDALETSAQLFKKCLRSNDFIARYGGDEFYIILDISNRKALEETLCRINKCIESFNDSNTKPYKLNFSMGYAVYDSHSRMKAKEFQKQIDLLMYENKRANKECIK